MIHKIRYTLIRWLAGNDAIVIGVTASGVHWNAGQDAYLKANLYDHTDLDPMFACPVVTYTTTSETT